MELPSPQGGSGSIEAISQGSVLTEGTVQILYQTKGKKEIGALCSGEVTARSFTSDHFVPHALAEQILLMTPPVLREIVTGGLDNHGPFEREMKVRMKSIKALRPSSRAVLPLEMCSEEAERCLRADGPRRVTCREV